MLRKVRREGLTSEQLAALGGSSRIDDSEVRASSDSGAKPDSGVKAKIDEIEQQMVGDGYVGSPRRAPEFYNAPTPARAPMGDTARTEPAPLRDAPSRRDRRRGQVERVATPRADRRPPPPLGKRRRLAPACAPLELRMSAAARLRQAVRRRAERSRARPRARRGGDRLRQRRLRAVRAVACRPDRPRRRTRRSTPRPGWCCSTCTAPSASSTSSRAWRSTTRSSSAGRRRSGSRCPSWWPRPPAMNRRARPRIDGQVGWVCPSYLDADAVAKLSSQTLQMPLPWVFDWGALKSIDAEACARLSELFRKLDPAEARHALARRRTPVHGAAGSRAHRRARCRPGVLAAAPGRAAHDQPARPVRRGGDRLLRHLRGLAAVVGAGRAARCASAARAEHRPRRRCRW